MAALSASYTLLAAPAATPPSGVAAGVLAGSAMPMTGLMGSRLDRPRPVGVAPGATGAGEAGAAGGLAGSCTTGRAHAQLGAQQIFPCCRLCCFPLSEASHRDAAVYLPGRWSCQTAQQAPRWVQLLPPPHRQLAPPAAGWSWWRASCRAAPRPGRLQGEGGRQERGLG